MNRIAQNWVEAAAGLKPLIAAEYVGDGLWRLRQPLPRHAMGGLASEDAIRAAGYALPNRTRRSQP